MCLSSLAACRRSLRKWVRAALRTLPNLCRWGPRKSLLNHLLFFIALCVLSHMIVVFRNLSSTIYFSWDVGIYLHFLIILVLNSFFSVLNECNYFERRCHVRYPNDKRRRTRLQREDAGRGGEGGRDKRSPQLPPPKLTGGGLSVT